MEILLVVKIVILAIVFLVTSAKQFTKDDYDAFFDFETGVKKENESVAVHIPFTGSGCSTIGVLKIMLSKDDVRKKRVLVDMEMTSPTGWLFDLGDSDTNNGYAGDAMTQASDAEVQGLDGFMSAYYSDNGGSGLAFSLPNKFTKRVTLVAGDSHVTWIFDDDVTTANYFSSPGLYGLKGQWQCEGSVNYDLYLGINGVVDGGAYSGRTGSGVCRVGLKILPEI
ncbi:uncharacterized protein LOC131938683 [Physella acuta]|uniref:uncharacterized protein LOC131938683 n=1 Tax=Physella acuta TaxID=109671 RepID=UPI0027DE65FB|nr:uncharacterized protein LOC131938683 [Physella acuta]XP_059152794.1 uncharacterized protein LOC131938683 [Physella acuta]XP_059152795.1 uncharacterized protein LOC131938683 [Physella acuta]